MGHFDVIVVGAGLGGLECGYILSRKGYNVCVLEKNDLIGGCLQSYTRNGQVLDTGFHYVGGLDSGEELNILFDYLGLLSLPWKRMDDDCFDEIIIKGKSYPFAMGYERFTETLSGLFPSQHDNLKRYIQVLHDVGKNISDGFKSKSNEDLQSSLFARSAWDFLRETITDPLLRNVLSGASLKLELSKEKLPLYIFSQINSSFIQSAWRLQGGGSQIADSLAQSISRMGGVVRTRAEVTSLHENGGSITEVVLSTGEILTSRYVISDLHPAATLSLIPETKIIRKIYRNRITSLNNTRGTFTASLILKKGRIPYLNRNQYIYNCDDLWERGNGAADRAMISYYTPRDGETCAPAIDIMAPVPWEEVSRWAGTPVGRRGEEYLDYKRKKADELIRFVSRYIPIKEEDIEHIHTSTPLTYQNYTGTVNGSSYGIEKDYNNLLGTLLTPKTPLQNLFMTGQNLNLHGILGVSMTSVLTCKEITHELL